ncbi:hypothetical protein [Agromyces mariniharenae]|uniref:Uncharacterized protein n=1 Tax=Agromyces mariniharenae TaxID=2604423 RepID=A0A5S4UX40_9MICO|nr:hypothetical protein [Agromyces mariniharenae]TYL51132.1 hypothetical protein FYC51_18615 [Agromyces mariniharenae]
MTVSAAHHEPPAFDVREFARTAQGSLRDDLDLAAIRAAPPAPDVARTLAALAVLEGATMAHLRNVLVTSTHKDARVTAFLVTWAFEKFWIADALRAIVAAGAGGEPSSAGVPGAAPARTSRVAASSGRGPVRRALAGFTQGWAVVGVHMAVGFVDDRMLRAAHLRVVDVARSPALAAAVDRILRVKARHVEFFEAEARARLGASTRAARLARRELRRTAWPLGRSALGPAELTAFARFAFGGEAGDAALRTLADEIREVPGLDARTAASVTAGLTTLAARPAA